MKNFNAIVLWIISFVGFGGLVIFYQTFSKPWVNFSIESVSYRGETYQEIYFRNTSENLNNSAQIVIPFSVDKDNPNQIEARLGTSSKDYKNENGEISMILGASQYVNLACQDCKINRSSIRNMTPSDFSLNECLPEQGSCIYQDKFSFYINKLLHIFMYLSWIVGFLLLLLSSLYKTKTE